MAGGTFYMTFYVCALVVVSARGDDFEDLLRDPEGKLNFWFSCPREDGWNNFDGGHENRAMMEKKKGKVWQHEWHMAPTLLLCLEQSADPAGQGCPHRELQADHATTAHALVGLLVKQGKHGEAEMYGDEEALKHDEELKQKNLDNCHSDRTDILKNTSVLAVALRKLEPIQATDAEKYGDEEGNEDDDVMMYEEAHEDCRALKYDKEPKLKNLDNCPSEEHATLKNDTMLVGQMRRQAHVIKTKLCADEEDSKNDDAVAHVEVLEGWQGDQGPPREGYSIREGTAQNDGQGRLEGERSYVNNEAHGIVYPTFICTAEGKPNREQ